MKSLLIKTMVVLAASFFAFVAHSQNCTIKCREYDARKHIQIKPVAFSLTLESKKKIKLTSNKQGVIVINKATYQKIKNLYIKSFDFFNPLDHEYYGEPFQLYKQRKKLSEICGVTLFVDRIW